LLSVVSAQRTFQPDITEAGLLPVLSSLPKLKAIELTNVQISTSAMDVISGYPRHRVRVSSECRAPTPEHRRAATKLATFGVEVQSYWYRLPDPQEERVPLDEEWFRVQFGRGLLGQGFTPDPEVGELLARLSNVTSIRLAGDEVNDATVDLLSYLEQLRNITFDSGLITDTGIKRLAKQQHPSILLIRIRTRGAITMNGIGELSRLSSLRSLELRGVAVNDATIPQLATLVQLKRLTISGGAVSAAAEIRLKEILSNVEVKYTGRDKDRPEGHSTLNGKDHADLTFFGLTRAVRVIAVGTAIAGRPPYRSVRGTTTYGSSLRYVGQPAQ
jgi:hypothetical protein